MSGHSGLKFTKGEIKKLDLDLSHHQRVMVGLSWDPVDGKWMEDTAPPKWATEKTDSEVVEAAHRIFSYLYDVTRSFAYLAHVRSGEKVKDEKGRDKNYNQFDLDLICYVLDKNGNQAAYSGPASADVIDEKEVIYHSGENFSGYGGYDDEQIHIEVNKVPEEYRNIFFVVDSDCKFSLDEVNNPSIRLVNCLTDENILDIPINAPAPINAYAYVFGRLFHDGDSWYFHFIDEYTDDEKSDWPKFLNQFTKSPQG